VRTWVGGLGKRKELTITKPKRFPPAADVLHLVETSLDTDKAENVVVIDLTGKTEIADYLIIATGTSQRQVGALSDHLQRKMKSFGLGSVAVEGEPQCDWVLIDAGDVIVHLFRPDVRDSYNLEKIWMDSGTSAGMTA